MKDVDVRTAAHDPESRVSEDDHDALRLWLRLLTCTLLIQQSVRVRLRRSFGISLSRFDLMAQLERNPGGLKMGELSKRLMVTGGNVTLLTDQLVAEQLVERRSIPGDRRAFAVRLTSKGKRLLDEMAATHERWVIDMLGDLPHSDHARLYALLGRLKHSVRIREVQADGSKR